MPHVTSLKKGPICWYNKYFQEFNHDGAIRGQLSIQNDCGNLSQMLFTSKFHSLPSYEIAFLGLLTNIYLRLYGVTLREVS